MSLAGVILPRKEKNIMRVKTKQVTFSTRGILVSTTDTRLANKLNQKVTVRSLCNGLPAHYETTDDNTILIFVGRELYELET